jgi:hypothetical protein
MAVLGKLVGSILLGFEGSEKNEVGTFSVEIETQSVSGNTLQFSVNLTKALAGGLREIADSLEAGDYEQHPLGQVPEGPRS